MSPSCRLIFLFLFIAPAQLGAQQEADAEFLFEISDPAFPAGSGPIVCVDEAHENFHTAEGRYKPFADLLRRDGFRVKRYKKRLHSYSLKECSLFVSANPIGRGNRESWAYPHDSAFRRDELTALWRWVHSGGSLLLFVDHAPMPGAAGDLGQLLGVAMLNGYARADRSQPVPDLFTRDAGTLHEHPILEGRNPSERITSVATFTGHAFLPSKDFQPLITFPEGAEAWTDFRETLADQHKDTQPIFSISGWAHAGTRRLGQGRIVLVGEAALCTAQVTARSVMGMNHEKAGQNPQFCLNVVRWLAGLLD